MFGGRRFLLKSIHYDATHRADLFTLPCSPKVSHGHPPADTLLLVGFPQACMRCTCGTTCDAMPACRRSTEPHKPWLLL